MLKNRYTVSLFNVLLFICMTLSCGSPLFAGDMGNTEKQAETRKELTEQTEQYEKQQKFYEGLKKEFENHPVTKWRREIVRNKKAIAVLDKQLRDMVRFENEEQIEELRRANEELQKKIDAKKEEWELLKEKLDTARKQIELLKKQLGPARAEELLEDQIE